MIAEIEGKISSSGANLSEKSEDNLTGNVFGTLRYIPFNKAMKKILLQGIEPKNNVSNLIKNIQVEQWDKNIKFWPYDKEGEIDVFIEFENCIIGIEVKYLSGISSDDYITNEDDLNKQNSRNSIHQLARESRIISSKAKNKEKILIFIADQQSCRDVYEDVMKRNIIENDVNLVYITWQNILQSLNNLDNLNPYEVLMIDDLKKLLIRKGFKQFENFDIENINISTNYYNFK